jgi:hypothetical protein
MFISNAMICGGPEWDPVRTLFHRSMAVEIQVSTRSFADLGLRRAMPMILNAP